MTWVYDPHSGGVQLTDSRKRLVETTIRRLAEKHYAGRCGRVAIRFRKQLCYIDAIREEDGRVVTFPLCRLRHFDLDRWSIALFTWSHQKYDEPSMFPTGTWCGTLEECVALGGVFL